MLNLTEGKPLPLILKFAIPVFLGNVFQLFYNLADTRIVGYYLGDSALAAVGITSSLNNMLIGFITGMANGFAVIAARHYGARDRRGLKRTSAAAFVMGILISVALTVVLEIGLRGIMHLLNTPDDLLLEAENYFRIILVGMIISMVYNVCLGLLRAIGDAVTPLIFLIISSLMNVGLDILFVGPMDMGVAGAAIATVLSQVFSLVLCFVYLWKKYDILRFGKEELHLHRGITLNILEAGFSMGFMNALVNIGTVFLQGAVNGLGNNDYIVAQTAARKLTELFMLIFPVFGTTMVTYTSQNYGAGKLWRIRQGVVICTLTAWAWSLIVILASHTIAPQLIHMVTGTTNDFIIANARRYLIIDTSLYFIPAFISIGRNALQGVGDAVTPIVSSLCELACKAVFALALAPVFGYIAIIWAEPFSWIIMVIPLLIRSLKTPVLSRKYREKES